MKKNILFFLLYTIMCFTSYSQNKQISYSSVNGLVTYDNGSGTKADIGAKLYIIPCKYFKQDIELKNDSVIKDNGDNTSIVSLNKDGSFPKHVWNCNLHNINE